MKFSLPLIGGAFAALLTPALGCVEAKGDVYDGVFGAVTMSVTLADNGVVYCDSDWGWRIDQDNHYSLTCSPGYVYAFTQDAKTAWYGRPGAAYSWKQSITSISDFCNPPQGEWCFTTSWDTRNYC